MSEVNETVQPELTPEQKIELNVSAHKVADDLLQLAREECPNEVKCKRFWEVLLNAAITECGAPLIPTPTKPMSPEDYSLFGEEEIPSGKYAGKTVASVHALPKGVGVQGLTDYAYKPSWFQLKLQSYLHTPQPGKKPKKQSKPKQERKKEEPKQEGQPVEPIPISTTSSEKESQNGVHSHPV